MTKRSIIFYWLLLFVPTIVIGALAFRLLSHEGDRIRRQRQTIAMERAKTIAGNIHLSMIAVTEGVTEALKRIRSDDPAGAILEWQRSNPLVRNVFIWLDRGGLRLPDPKEPATREERRFIARYEGLFNGRIPWDLAGGQEETRDASRGAGAREELKMLSRLRAPGVGGPAAFAVQKAGGERGGWIPWFSENQLFVLGWYRKIPGGPVIGAELEMAAVLSRLLKDMPQKVPEGSVYALLDGSGQVMHQSGADLIGPDARPDLSVALAPHLPHWQVAVFFTGRAGGADAGRGVVVLFGLLLAIFLAAILLGGSLLLWQAHRNMLDARQKTSFVSNVSHELKTPLTSIRMYAELLSEGRVTDPEKRAQYVDVIVSESRRLTRLVNNVLDFSRLEQGRKKYHTTNMDAARCVREVLEAQGPRLEEAGIRLRMALHGEPLVVFMDRDALEQVLLNLIDNCVKYGAGEGSDPELAVELEPLKDHCEIRILDNGPGIPPGHRQRIFDKFHRVDDSLTARQPGSGLGLSISRRLLRDLGGDLVYRPGDVKGSCFVVKLPWGKRDEEHSHPDS